MSPNAFVARGTDSQPQRYVIAEADSIDDLQRDGAWISAAETRVVER